MPENKFNFKLIDQEISEARLFRTSNNFRNLTGREVANLLYLTTLSTWMMTKDSKQESFARSYLKQSTQYGPYILFRSHATDLFLLAYHVNDPENKNIKLKNNIESKRFLKSLQFNNRQHWLNMSKISSGKDRNSEMYSFFMRLESQLKISDSRYKKWRRLVSDWGNLKYTARQLVVTSILQEYRRIAKGSEMVSPLSTMTRYKKYIVTDKEKPSTAKRVAGAVAGAAAGRYAGKKIAQKTGKNIDKYKKYGTGIGAIAGYWASGRQRQK
jgi:hypothetical protein